MFEKFTLNKNFYIELQPLVNNFPKYFFLNLSPYFKATACKLELFGSKNGIATTLIPQDTKIYNTVKRIYLSLMYLIKLQVEVDKCTVRLM